MVKHMVINSPLGKETTRECGVIEIEKHLRKRILLKRIEIKFSA